MDEVSQIREKIDLVSFILEYVPLKKMGRNFKAICPFHNEKTPSFIVSPERQIWHCFGGCNKGGDVYTFLMEYEKLEFIEALRILAKRTGVVLRESNFQTGVSSKKEKIYKLNKIALDFYNFVLTKHTAGKKALAYLSGKRKLDIELIETFNLGFSPKDGVSLVNYLIKKKKYKREDLVEAGLAFYKQGSVFDFFRNRLMFPLFDHRNNVVGFAGRAIEEPYQGGKYINTKETLVYHKGDMFFGLNTAKDEIKKMDKAIIVEGELDVISCFSQGVKNVVAVKGTALTENQVSLLTRFTNSICLSFDADEAGYTATKRSLEVLEKKGAHITICVFENGKDADEAIRSDTVVFKKAIKKDIPVYDYVFMKIFSQNDKNKVEGKRKITDEFLPIISKIENEIIKEHYLKKLSSEIDVSLDALVTEIEKIHKKEVVKKDLFVLPKDKKSRLEMLEDYLFSLIVQSENPKLILEKSLVILKDYKFETVSYQKILDYLSGFFKTHDIFKSRDFLNILPKELASSFDTAFLYPLPKFEMAEFEKEAEKVVREMKILFLKNKIKEISISLKAGEGTQDIQKITDLEKELALTVGLLGNRKM
ncbi:MAG: DNA primase [Candidatus Levybacteria bacterium]|nr:DNA primase [Candidatus Levybacteria bacterium]